MIEDPNNPTRKFAYEMAQELEKHDEEKTIKFFDLDIEQLKKLLESQFLKRMNSIMATNDSEEIKKQVTHLSNYCYFVWCKCK